MGIGPKGGDRIHQEGTQLEVEHIRAHSSTKEKQDLSLFERFVTEGNQRADQLAKDGAMLDGGEMAQTRASIVQQRREEVGLRGVAASC